MAFHRNPEKRAQREAERAEKAARADKVKQRREKQKAADDFAESPAGRALLGRLSR